MESEIVILQKQPFFTSFSKFTRPVVRAGKRGSKIFRFQENEFCVNESNLYIGTGVGHSSYPFSQKSEPSKHYFFNDIEVQETNFFNYQIYP